MSVEPNTPEMERVRAITGAIERELLRAMELHPPMHSPHEGHSVIREELDPELWAHVTGDTGRSADAAKEVIQLGAMAARYVYDLVPGFDGEPVDGAVHPGEDAPAARRVWSIVHWSARQAGLDDTTAMALADLARIEVERETPTGDPEGRRR